MRGYRTYLLLAALFVATSVAVYSIHYAIFRDSHHIFIYMIGDLAFLPLEVFLVVVVIERLLNRREKQALRKKLNMVIGAFYSEVGTPLLRDLLGCFRSKDAISQRLEITRDWTAADFRKAAAFASSLDYHPDSSCIDLDKLRTTLVDKQQFLLRLLENPNLLEHERFTDLLWATFHLTEELEARESLAGLPQSDLNHISVDIERLYSRLVVEWVSYVQHLQGSYPFLFSLVTRTHPFLKEPGAVITE